VGFDISALLNPKARSLFGLDISSSAVKMVELSSNGKDGYRVERYTIEVLPKDAVSDGNIANLEGVVDCVKRAWKRMGTSTRNVAMALPGSAVITKKSSYPPACGMRSLRPRLKQRPINTFRFRLMKSIWITRSLAPPLPCLMNLRF
jgi:Tfp pilus assembly PilM family ATPase